MKKILLNILHKINGSFYIENRLNNLDYEIKKLANDVEYLRGNFSFNSTATPYFGLKAPLFLLKNGRLAFKLDQGDCNERVFVLSIPKSGTYLVAALLERINIINAGVHLWEDGFHDYRNRIIPEMVHKYKNFAVNLPLNKSLDLLLPGQFSVGHLAHTENNCEALKDFKLFMTIREMRSVLISFMRWYSNEGRGEQHGQEWKSIQDKKDRMYCFLSLFIEELLSWSKEIIGWVEYSKVQQIKFEDLLGDFGYERQISVVEHILDYVGLEKDRGTAEVILKDVINKPTKTWSGKRSDLSEYWSDRCEDIFISFKGSELNEALGYNIT